MHHRRACRSPAGSSPSTRATSGEIYGFVVIAVARRRRCTGSSSAAPASASTCAPSASPSRPPRPAASTSSGWSLTACCISGAVAGLVGMPTLLGDSHTLQHRLPAGIGFTGIAIALLGRNTRSASPSARCCGASSSAPPATRVRGLRQGDRRRHAGRHRPVRRHRLRGRTPLRASPPAAHGSARNSPPRPPHHDRRQQEVAAMTATMSSTPSPSPRHPRRPAPRPPRPVAPRRPADHRGRPDRWCPLVRVITGADELTSSGQVVRGARRSPCRSASPASAACGPSARASSTSASKA